MTENSCRLWTNYVFRLGILLIISGFILNAGLIVYGHALITKVLVAKTQIIDLSEPITAKKYRQLTEDYHATEKERLMLSGVRPVKREIAYFVQALDVVATKTQVIQTVEVEKQTGTDNKNQGLVPYIRYKIGVAGTSANILTYLREIGKMPYLLRLVSVKINAVEEKTIAESAVGSVLLEVAVKE